MRELGADYNLTLQNNETQEEVEQAKKQFMDQLVQAKQAGLPQE